MHRERFCQMSGHTDKTAPCVIFLTNTPNRERGILSSCCQRHPWALKHNARKKKRKENPFKPTNNDVSPTIWKDGTNYLAPPVLETFYPKSPVSWKAAVRGIVQILALKRSPQIWIPCWAIQQKVLYKATVLKQPCARQEQVGRTHCSVKYLFMQLLSFWSIADQRWTRACLFCYIGLLLY